MAGPNNDIHTVERALDSLRPLAAQHLKIGREMTEVYGGAVYGMDLLAYGALNRSKAHLSGFCQLIRDRNLVCAGAVLRLQLDTALGFSAAWLVENPHAFAIAVLQGQHVRKLADRSGNRMSDAYLVETLGREYPWVRRVSETERGVWQLIATRE